MRIGRLPPALVVVALVACQRDPEPPGEARRIDLGSVTLQRTTPGEVERLFGAPDVRDADGSLVYQRVAFGRHQESVTFRFTDGVLARVCRARAPRAGGRP